MTIPALPSEGSSDWYDWAAGIDAAARDAQLIPTGTADPGSPEVGYTYVNTTDETLRIWLGSAWYTVSLVEELTTDPSIRGVELNSGLGAVVPLPAGTVAGDSAVVFGFSAGSEGIPTMTGITGWTTLQTSSGWGGRITAWKVLTSGDITTGSVTVSGTAPMFGALVTSSKATAVSIGSSQVGGGSVTSTGAAAGTVVAGDALVWIALSRKSSGSPPLPTTSRGVLHDTFQDTNFAALIKSESPAAGSVTDTATSTTVQAMVLAAVAFR